MRLNTREKRRLLELIDDTWRKKNCILCGESKWTLSGTVFEMREMQQEGDIGIDKKLPIFPVIPIACQKCGNTHLINPVVIGLFDEDLLDEEGELDE